MLWVLRMDPRLKVFYSCYTETLYVIFNTDGYERASKFRIYRDGEIIFEGLREDFHHPEEFDRDNHTELFTKLSKHELCYHDMSVEKYQTYLYHVDFVDEEDNILLDTRVKIVKIE